MRPGISSEALARAGVVAVSAEQAEAMCGLATEGLFIPYHGLDGAPVLDNGKPYGRLRLARALSTKKYHQAFGSGVHAYLPPGLENVPRGSDLFVIEGEFKSLSLTEAGFPAVGISGFFGFAVRGGEAFTPELAQAIERIQPSRIFFCGDSDTALNAQFATAAVRFAAMVAPTPLLLPRIPYTGPGKGADDCRHALGGDFNDWWRARITDAMHVGPQSDAPVLAVRLFEREESGLAELDGDALAKAQERLVKLAAALHRSVLLQERVVSFVEKKLKIRRSVFNRAVEAAVKAGALPSEPDDLEVYYDPSRKCYWLPNNRGEMIEINETSVVKHLRKAGFGGDKEDGLSPLDQRIIQIQRERDVAYAGPLGGHRTGLHEMCGCRVLVTRSPRIIEPRGGDCPNINALIRGLLADETHDQVGYVLGWLKIAYEALVEGSLRPGQALAIAGPRNSGKSLLQNLITEILGGRAAKPYRYMCGNTDFNGDLFGAEHLMIEDEVSFTDIRARRHFGARIKDFTVNLVQSCHAKNRQALSLKPFWRVTITLNDEPENLLILPPIDESLEDKIILLKATKATLPVDTSTSAGRQKFMSMLLDELPAFLWHLTQFQIPAELKSERFGITHLHHPDLLAALDDMSPELRLLTLIDGMIAENDEAGEWHGTAADLERLLFESKYAHEARRLLDWNNATGTYLGRLAKKCPQRVKAVRNAQRREWIITPAHWIQESDTVEVTPNPF